MKILIIGNGFDLAHGLPTKYTHFLNNSKRFLSITKVIWEIRLSSTLALRHIEEMTVSQSVSDRLDPAEDIVSETIGVPKRIRDRRHLSQCNYSVISIVNNGCRIVYLIYLLHNTIQPIVFSACRIPAPADRTYRIPICIVDKTPNGRLIFILQYLTIFVSIW